MRTTIGFGSPNKANTSEAHGSPLGADEVKATKKALGWDPEQAFFVPDEAARTSAQRVERGAKAEADWQQRFEAWAAAHPDLAAEWRAAQAGELPARLGGGPAHLHAPDEQVATRKSRRQGDRRGRSEASRWFLGGDADLSVSTLTDLARAGDFDGQTGAGRNIRFGVREHAMGAIANGMHLSRRAAHLHRDLLHLLGLQRPAMRLAALNHLPVIFVFTHDSIGLGEDGPTHQPVEHLASLRAMPGMWVCARATPTRWPRPGKLALNRKNGPTTIVLCRQNVPTLDRAKYGAAAGAATRRLRAVATPTAATPRRS